MVLANLPGGESVDLHLGVILTTVISILAWIGPKGALRAFLIVTILYASARYIGWRITDTLPFNDGWAIIPGILLLCAELYGFLVLCLGLFVNTDPTPRPSVGFSMQSPDLPSVDVLIPTYDETPELLRATLVAAQVIRYPGDKLNVYLCDDGGTENKCTQADEKARKAAIARAADLKTICKELGVTYLTRKKNERAKAGNINEALKETNGDLVVILDSDHVPTRDFLEKTVGHFLKDEKLFLVQTPHFFINADPLEKNLGTFLDMPSENEMFYSVIQPGLDRWGASLFCGSAGILRRKCLDEIGGMAGETITEDAETAVRLHSKGYKSAFVNRPLIAGLAPDTFEAFAKQRTRWAQGMTQILVMINPATLKGLSLSQRLGYLNSTVFWLFPFARAAFYLAPLIYLLLGVPVIIAESNEIFAFAIPHLLGTVLLSVILFRGTRWLFVSEIYESLQMGHCMAGIISVFKNPRAPKFNVTPKAENQEEDTISSIAWPYYILLAAILAGEIMGVLKLIYDEDTLIAGIILVWNSFNLILCVAVIGVLLERRQIRDWPRMPHNRHAKLRIGDNQFDTDVFDVSLTGAGLTINADVDLDKLSTPKGELEITEFTDSDLVSLPLNLAWVEKQDGKTFLGVEFTPKTIKERRSCVTFCYGRSDDWVKFQDYRTSRPGISHKVSFIFSRTFVRFFQHMKILFLQIFRRTPGDRVHGN